MFYTYAHYTPKGDLFYIGKGRGSRAYSSKGRNKFWQNVVEKYGKPHVHIVRHWLTEAEAFSHEIELIAQFKSLGIRLCNFTNGGEGQTGVVPWNKGVPCSDETKEKIRLMNVGRTPWNLGIPMDDDMKKRISETKKGTVSWNKGVPCREETKDKLREALTGKEIHSEEFKQRISDLHKGNKWRLGIPTSAKQKAAASKTFKGNKHAAGNTTNRQWVWVGTDIKTGEVKKFIGEKEMKAAGIQHANVIKCINGVRKSHKGYSWTREPWESKLCHS